jgi:hypothetical protein
MRFIALAALTLLLVGCVPADPVVTPVPVPSSTPLFATDADALKAATDAYAAYLAMSDRITADGGANPERIAPFVTKAQMKSETSAFNSYRAQQHSTVGASKFDSVTLENFQGNSVSIYLCLDFSNIRLVDPNGSDITPSSVPERSPLEVSLVRGPGDPASLVIERNEPWTGKNFCL